MDASRQKDSGDLKADQEELEQKIEIPAALTEQDGIDEEQLAMFRRFVAADEGFHEIMTKKLIRKVDFHLLPILILMYLLNFLDRKYVHHHNLLSSLILGRHSLTCAHAATYRRRDLVVWRRTSG